MYVCMYIGVVGNLEHEGHRIIEGLRVDVAPLGGVLLDAHVDVDEVVAVLGGTQPRIAAGSLHSQSNIVNANAFSETRDYHSNTLIHSWIPATDNCTGRLASG